MTCVVMRNSHVRGEAEEDWRRELIDGEAIVSAPLSDQHRSAAGKLYSLLEPFVRERNLGRLFRAPFDLIFDELDVVQPDLLFISNSRIESADEATVRGSPDLVVELVTPESEPVDCDFKQQLYARFGVSECWMVELDKCQVEVHVLEEKGYRLVPQGPDGQAAPSHVLDGFVWRVPDILQVSPSV